MRVPATVRRVATLTGVAALFLMLAGATYQGVATALERRGLPHPGQLVPAGDHQLHIYCNGDGSPTVVLEAGAGAMSAWWGGVQPRVSLTTRVCSYDRAGLGWSEAGDRPFAPEDVPAGLLALLDGSGERAPVVLAGRGLGAAFAKMFAARHPDRVAALILIDAPDGGSGLRDGRLADITSATPWLARVGIRRLLRAAIAQTRGLPQPSADALRSFLYRPDHLSRAAVEIARWRDAVRLADAQTTPLTSLVPVREAPNDPGLIAAAIEAAVAQARGQ
jgi:pimeloyl-ACP methyl ester carboxylesterase